ncbi:jg21487 [Pararge aegeria aegeria]|uniref:Jg21487 protein n=1 Tax=Pararge aegeria aegeria TaxID=348720 RepID=A0A8S4RR82_9NEOP|nr:jg21487 [Pararge aegeria aegeria]
MEAEGESLLIEGDIPKSFKDSAAYLRQLTTFQDEISLSNSSLQSATVMKINSLMASVTPRGYSKSVMSGIKTEALKVLIEQMDRHGQNVLLRHGTLRKTYSDGSDILRSKNADQLGVLSADPVVARKIQIKLRNLMYSCTPDKYLTLMDDVIEDATLYLAVHFLQPRVIQVCKCMKNVFVQCELWCDEILRRMARPCCTCSRHVSAQALADLAGPGQQILVSPSCSRAYAPGIEISVKPCPSRPNKFLNQERQPCPAENPNDGCKGSTTPSYCLYSSSYYHRYPYSTSPEILQSSLDSEKIQSQGLLPSNLSSSMLFLDSTENSPTLFNEQPEKLSILERREPPGLPEERKKESDSSPPVSFYTPGSTNSDSFNAAQPFWQTPTTMFTKVNTPFERSPDESTPTSVTLPRRMAAVKRGYTARESWTTFSRRVATEALQWRQYNNFSRQLTLRLALRYRDKKIVSPTRATVKTDIYIECQNEMLDIIDMFNRWTRWLAVVIKETDSIPLSDSQKPAFEVQWKYFKTKVEEYLDDWDKYNTHLKVCWEQKYRSLISDWIPTASWRQPGPVWVVSACGAVPSGAVAAGVYEGEVTWVARTTHRRNVLPAALHPAKHCCIVYSDGAVHHYTKYQVMCNAEVSWVACRAAGLASAGGLGGMDKIGARAVRVAPGVHVGRVHYRGSHLVGAVHAPMYCCHVVIFGRPFAFNCYELLVLAQSY